MIVTHYLGTFVVASIRADDYQAYPNYDASHALEHAVHWFASDPAWRPPAAALPAGVVDAAERFNRTHSWRIVR